MLGGMGIQEIFIIFLVMAAIFGAKKLPELGKGLGGGIKEFKEGLKEITK